LKYKKDVALGEILARSLIHLFRNLNWVVDIVIPVPLSAERMVQRGYNQAGLLATPLALSQGIAYRPQALCKVRETPSQVGLSVVERQANLKGAFCAQGRMVIGKRVLVVDDVTTSGATLDACGVALLEAGAQIVYGLTLARTLQAVPHRHSVLPPDMPSLALSRN
jgi:ComF family protein